MGSKNSRIAGFYQLTPSARLEEVGKFDGLQPVELAALRGGQGTLSIERADKMIENVIGTFELPLGIATNFRINGRDVLIPMAVEEPSIVAGASFAAKLARVAGGFSTSSTRSLMIGQIQVVGIDDLQAAEAAIFAHQQEILETANAQSTTLVKLGGGAEDIEVRTFASSPVGAMLIVHLIVDCLDAMGANAVNSMAEAVAPLIERVTGGQTYLRILSNLSDRRLAKAWTVIPAHALDRPDLSGEEVIDSILHAYAFAAVDPYRATTHNKGILNGIDPVLVATGQDWRAIEAGAHAYAARNGHYTSLTTWRRDEEGNLYGELEMPFAVGIVGGATRVHPAAAASLKLLGVSSARELAEVCACAGLASNLAAMRALATEGIQQGHMALHARQIAMSSGATGALIDVIADQLVWERTIKASRAAELLAEHTAVLAI